MPRPDSVIQAYAFSPIQVKDGTLVQTLRTSNGVQRLCGSRALFRELAHEILNCLGEMQPTANPDLASPVRRRGEVRKYVPQFLQVQAGLKSGLYLTQADACEAVGVRYNLFTRWLCAERKASKKSPGAPIEKPSGGIL